MEGEGGFGEEISEYNTPKYRFEPYVRDARNVTEQLGGGTRGVFAVICLVFFSCVVIAMLVLGAPTISWVALTVCLGFAAYVFFRL